MTDKDSCSPILLFEKLNLEQNADNAEKVIPLKKKFIISILFIIVHTFSAVSVQAWTEHPLITYPVMATLTEVRSAQPIKVESLDSFLNQEGKKLEKLLAQEEEWARKNLKSYAPLPDSLVFKATGKQRNIRLRFCQAIRINPRVTFPLYLQLIPGQDKAGRNTIFPKNLTFLRDVSDWNRTTFVELKEGELVRPIDVVVSASDEPDFLGLDIGLFADNNTDFGKKYGFGKQPFGDPYLEFGSQAPFHMGFYHESFITNVLAGSLRKVYPEYRIHLYRKLATFAFRTGHHYWGWRFMGWGLHYLADLVQPYHATALPRVSTFYAVWINTIDKIGIHSPKDNAIQLVSNRHLALEKFLQIILQRAYRDKETNNPILAALQSTEKIPLYDDAFPRALVSKLAHDKAEGTDEALEKNMPAKFVSDPQFKLGNNPEREQIVEKIRAEKGQTAIDNLVMLGRDLLKPFATYGHSYVQKILQEAK